MPVKFVFYSFRTQTYDITSNGTSLYEFWVQYMELYFVVWISCLPIFAVWYGSLTFNFCTGFTLVILHSYSLSPIHCRRTRRHQSQVFDLGRLWQINAVLLKFGKGTRARRPYGVRFTRGNPKGLVQSPSHKGSAFYVGT